jgi:deoxyribonuclease V
MSLSNSYNRDMRVKQLHGWKLSTNEAINLQRELAVQVITDGDIIKSDYIAGVDMSVNRVKGIARAAVVVLSYPGLRIIETRIAQSTIDFPYIPGLLSFRELPLILTACEKLDIKPDLFIVDGQGIAHPRRLGLASHLGLFLDTPTIGCAKSLLCGKCDEPVLEKGNYTRITDGNDTIGAVLRTRQGVKPVYISTGHKIGLQPAIQWVLNCCNGYRLPEPTRQAHLAASIKNTKEKNLVYNDI